MAIAAPSAHDTGPFVLTFNQQPRLIAGKAAYFSVTVMNYLAFWAFGFGTLWAGIRLFDDEVLLIVSMIVGSASVLSGLLCAPAKLQVTIEVVLIIALFRVCMECIQRGDAS